MVEYFEYPGILALVALAHAMAVVRLHRASKDRVLPYCRTQNADNMMVMEFLYELC